MKNDSLKNIICKGYRIWSFCFLVLSYCLVCFFFMVMMVRMMSPFLCFSQDANPAYQPKRNIQHNKRPKFSVLEEHPDLWPHHQMERHSQECHVESWQDIFDCVVYNRMFWVEFLHSWSLTFLLPKELICDLNELYPIQEGNEISWIYAMPKGTHHNSVELSCSLRSFPLFLISIFISLIKVLVYVPFQCPLNTYVPVINFDLEIWL